MVGSCVNGDGGCGDRIAVSFVAVVVAVVGVAAAAAAVVVVVVVVVVTVGNVHLV